MVGRKALSAVRMWLLTAGLACVIFALATARAGGFDIRLAGLRFRSHSAMRPALIAAALAVAVGWLDRRRLAGLSAAAWGGMTAAAAAPALTVAALAWTLAAALLFGTFAIGGADSFGYVSQARLLARGKLIDVIPVQPQFSWPNVEATLI